MASERAKRQGWTYWVVTLLFVLPLMTAGVTFLMGMQSNVDNIVATFGYPMYIMKILGAAKILGGIAILYGRFRTLKEWAYPGFTLNMIGAIASHIFAHQGLRQYDPELALTLRNPELLLAMEERQRIEPALEPPQRHHGTAGRRVEVNGRADQVRSGRWRRSKTRLRMHSWRRWRRGREPGCRTSPRHGYSRRRPAADRPCPPCARGSGRAVRAGRGGG